MAFKLAVILFYAAFGCGTWGVIYTPVNTFFSRENKQFEYSIALFFTGVVILNLLIAVYSEICTRFKISLTTLRTIYVFAVLIATVGACLFGFSNDQQLMGIGAMMKVSMSGYFFVFSVKHVLSEKDINIFIIAYNMYPVLAWLYSITGAEPWMISASELCILTILTPFIVYNSRVLVPGENSKTETQPLFVKCIVWIFCFVVMMGPLYPFTSYFVTMLEAMYNDTKTVEEIKRFYGDIATIVGCFFMGIVLTWIVKSLKWRMIMNLLFLAGIGVTHIIGTIVSMKIWAIIDVSYALLFFSMLPMLFDWAYSSGVRVYLLALPGMTLLAYTSLALEKTYASKEYIILVAVFLGTSFVLSAVLLFLIIWTSKPEKESDPELDQAETQV